MPHIVQELCESRGGRPGLSVLTSLLVSVDVKLYWTMLRHWSQLVPNMSTDIRGHLATQQQQQPWFFHVPASCNTYGTFTTFVLYVFPGGRRRVATSAALTRCPFVSEHRLWALLIMLLSVGTVMASVRGCQVSVCVYVCVRARMWACVRAHLCVCVR